jgi:hypothetical protein
MVLEGKVINGQIVLGPAHPPLPEGARVRVELIVDPLEPRDEWERGLLEAARNWGVSLPDSALSSEGLYD